MFDPFDIFRRRNELVYEIDSHEHDEDRQEHREEDGKTFPIRSYYGGNAGHGLIGKGDGSRDMGLRIGSGIEFFPSDPRKSERHVDSDIRGDADRRIVFLPGEPVILVRIWRKRNALDVNVFGKDAYPLGRSDIERASRSHGGILVSGAMEIAAAFPRVDFSVEASGGRDRSGMRDSIIASDEPKHFDASDAAASGNGAVSIPDASRSGWTVRVGGDDPPEDEPFGNRGILLDEIEFAKGFSGDERGRSGAKLFVIVVTSGSAIAVFIAQIAVGVGIGIEKLQGVLSVPLGHSRHVGSCRIERRKTSARPHWRSVSAETEILSGSESAPRSDAASRSVVSESGKVGVSSADIGGGKVSDIRSGAHGEPVPVFLVVYDAAVLYDRNEALDVVVEVLSQIYPVAHVGSVSGDLPESLKSENENDGQYGDGDQHFDEREGFRVLLFDEPPLFFQNEVEKGRKAPSRRYRGGTFPKMPRTGNENEIENFEETVFRKGFSRFSDERCQEEEEA